MKNLTYIITILLFLISCNEEKLVNDSNQMPKLSSDFVTDISIYGNPLETFPKKGDLAPNFILNEGNVNEISLRDLRGKVVYLYFWYLGCPPCRASIPFLVDKYNKINDNDFVVITITIDQYRGYSQKQTKDFIEEFGMNFINVYDGSTADDFISAFYNLRFTPSYLLLNKDGIVSEVISPTSENFISRVQQELAR